MEVDSVVCMDALELLNSLDAQSVDAILTDLPYGTTACSWDTIIPFDALWKAVKRVLKPRGVFVTTASQPFTSALVMSNPKWFRYEWIWDKGRGTNFANANKQPMKAHENIVVFSREPHYYAPIFWFSTPYRTNAGDRASEIEGLRGGSAANRRTETVSDDGRRFPLSIIDSDRATDAVHPTQKPVALYEYLTLTYTQERELVIDPCCGSGTTALAARNTGRHYIVGDSDPHYCEVTRQRLQHTSRAELNAALSGKPTTLPMFE